MKVAANARRKQNLIAAVESLSRMNSLVKLRNAIEQIIDAIPIKPLSKADKDSTQRDVDLLQGVKIVKAGQVKGDYIFHRRGS